MRVKKIAFFLMFILFSTGLLFSKENIERVVVISYSEALNEGDKIWLLNILRMKKECMFLS